MKNEIQSHASNPFINVPRCGAYSRRTGKPCRQPAMANGRCRMHGGKAGAPRGNVNALKHGLYTREVIVRRQYLRELIRESRETIEALR
jgi:uncharacterized protein YjcR